MAAHPSSSSLRRLICWVFTVSIVCFTAPASAFSTSLPSKVVTLPASTTYVITSLRPLLHQTQHQHHANASIQNKNTQLSVKPSPSSLHMVNDEEDANGSITNNKIYTPLDRPLLAIIDTISLTIFAAIGKSSHSADGSLDLLAVLVTAFPFITAWLTTSPLTGVYSPDDRDPNTNVAASTAIKVAKGWIVAVPLGIVLRGVIKGYVPPVPFMIVTLIATLVIVSGVRIGFSLVEDFFVELV